MSNPVVTSVTFDKGSYNVGDVITATVKYSDSNTHGVTAGQGNITPIANTFTPFTAATFGLKTQKAGDTVILHVITQGSAPPTSVSGGNCTWQQIGTTFTGTVNAGFSSAVFEGTVTTASPTTPVNTTVSFTGVPSSIRGVTQEYVSSTGQIVLVQQATVDNTGTNALPTLNPTAGNQLYSGFAFSSGTTTPGNTPGFTYEIDNNGNAYAFDTNCPQTPQTPTTGDSSNTFGIAVLLSVPLTTGTFTPVGGLIQSQTATVALNPNAVGDLIFLFVESEGSAPCTGITGGNCNWFQVGQPYAAQTAFNAGEQETVYVGVAVAAPGTPANATVTFNGTPTSINIRGHEFYSSTGQVSLVTQGALDSQAGTNQMPPLQPTAGGQLYMVSSLDSGTNVSGATPGYTYLQDINNNGFAFSQNCGTTVQAPTMGDATNRFGIAVLVSTAMPNSPGSGQPATSPLIVAIATHAGTDPFNNPFQQGINAEKGSITGTVLSVGNTLVVDNSGINVYNGAAQAANLQLAISPAGVVTKAPVVFNQFGGTPAANQAGGATAYSAHGDIEVVDGTDQQAYATQRRTIATGSDQNIVSTTFATFLQSAVKAGATAREYHIHGQIFCAPNQTGGKIGLRWTGPGATTGHINFTYRSPAASPATSNDESGALGNGVSTTGAISATMANGFETDVEVDGIIQVPAGISGLFTIDGAEGTAGDSFIVRQFSYIEVMPV